MKVVLAGRATQPAIYGFERVRYGINFDQLDDRNFMETAPRREPNCLQTRSPHSHLSLVRSSVMSEPSLLHPQSTPSPQNRPSSVKSGKQAISKSLKHAFSRRKRSMASFRSGKDDSDFDLSSQRSGSVG